MGFIFYAPQAENFFKRAGEAGGAGGEERGVIKQYS
ncbi:hypothetical protein NSTC745_02173 [Nostoc sp. DSM 114161]|jgi:hypothetical protein